MDELIAVRQLPIIEERLRDVKASIELMLAEVSAMVCTADTIQAVKDRRAELKKQFEFLENQRKAVKMAVLEPYDRFEAVYRECIRDAFLAADENLKRKISDVEDAIKGDCECKCRIYFSELCALHGVEWLRYEQAGLKISLTEAKKKTPSGLFLKLSEFVARVACDVDAMDGMNSDEGMAVMAEYKANGLNLAKAQRTVRDRREAAAAERKAAEERAERQKREAEAVAKVEAAAPVVAPPVAVNPPLISVEPRPEDVSPRYKTAAGEIIFMTRFTAHGTKEQLIKLREFMKQEGIQYE